MSTIGVLHIVCVIVAGCSVSATEYGRYIHGFDEAAQQLLPKYASKLNETQAQTLENVFGARNEDDKLADNEELWKEPEVVDQLVALTSETLMQLNVSKSMTNYLAMSIPRMIEMASEQIVNTPEARDSTRNALAAVMTLYDELSPEEKHQAKEWDEMTVLLLEHQGLRNQLKPTEQPNSVDKNEVEEVVLTTIKPDDHHEHTESAASPTKAMFVVLFLSLISLL